MFMLSKTGSLNEAQCGGCFLPSCFTAFLRSFIEQFMQLEAAFQSHSLLTSYSIYKYPYFKWINIHKCLC